MDSFNGEDLKFKLPAGMILAGPSSSGKTTLLMRLLDHYHTLFDPVPAEIVYAYGQYHSFIPRLAADGVTIHAGLPDEDFLQRCKRPLLLVLDDLMMSASEQYLTDLYTKKTHHEQLFTIFIAQSLFEKNLKVARNNSQYILLTRAPNAILSIRTLGTQLFPRQLNYFMDAYAQATKQPYGYLLVDSHPTTPSSLRLRTNIFPDDNRVVFIARNA